VEQLDGLRAVAVLMVLAFHLGIGLGRGGLFGVDIFLVLSGFLITGVLVGEYRARGRVSIGRFYARRMLRLYPALVVMVVLLMPFGPQLAANHDWGGWLASVGAALTYSSTIILIFNPHFDLSALGPTWTLATEEQFYLLWAPLCALLVARVVNLRRMAIIVTAMALALMSIFWWAWSPTDAIQGLALYYRPDPRFGELLLGGALALALAAYGHRLSRRWDLLVSVGAVIGLLGLVWARRNYPNVYGHGGNPLLPIPIVAICATLVLARLATSNTVLLSRLLRIPPLPYIGRISYGIYLWHLPLIMLVLLAGGNELMATAAVFAAAMLSYHLVEMPFLRLKGRMRSSGVAGLDAIEPQEGARAARATGPPDERRPAPVPVAAPVAAGDGVLDAAPVARPGEQRV